MKKLLFLLSMTIFLFPVQASSLTIDAIADYSVDQSMLAGMEVFVDTTGDGTYDQSGIWTYDSVTGFSGYNGSGWSIEFTGDDPDETYDTGSSNFYWVLTSDTVDIYGFKIDAYGDDVTGAHNFFDIYNEPSTSETRSHGSSNAGDEYTPGSDQGIWFPNNWEIYADQTPRYDSSGSVTNSGDLATLWDYQDGTIDGQGINYDWLFTEAVVLSGQTFFGDLYTTLEIDFFTDALSDGAFIFSLDTDVEATVPEPATLILFGLGLLGISAAGRKKTS